MTDHEYGPHSDGEDLLRAKVRELTFGNPGTPEVISLRARVQNLTDRLFAERTTVARRCEYLARCRGDLVTAADIRREFGLEER